MGEMGIESSPKNNLQERVADSGVRSSEVPPPVDITNLHNE